MTPKPSQCLMIMLSFEHAAFRDWNSAGSLESSLNSWCLPLSFSPSSSVLSRSSQTRIMHCPSVVGLFLVSTPELSLYITTARLLVIDVPLPISCGEEPRCHHQLKTGLCLRTRDPFRSLSYTSRRACPCYSPRVEEILQRYGLVETLTPSAC